jgi:hypothetical protein
VGAWLELDEQAGALVHPQHEIRVEIAKWLVSILCRGPQTTSADYPRHMLLRKMEMAQRQLAVLDVVDPGKGSVASWPKVRPHNSKWTVIISAGFSQKGSKVIEFCTSCVAFTFPHKCI